MSDSSYSNYTEFDTESEESDGEPDPDPFCILYDL
jgi:hypothetical protein